MIKFARASLRALLLAAALAGSALTVGAMPAAADAAPAGPLSVSKLSFEPVDHPVTAGSSVKLQFTVSDTNSAATAIGGDVYLSLETAPGAFVGVPVDVQFAYQNNLYNGAAYVSGTPQESTYSYTFTVPRYAAGASACWGVSKITAGDSTGATLTAGSAALAGFHAQVQATQLTYDNAAPSYSGLQFASNYTYKRPYTYDNGVPGLLSYQLTIQQDQSGFWKGSLGLRGPGGATLAVPFGIAQYSGQESCGTFSVNSPQYVMCDVAASLPAGSAAGTWYVSSVTLTTNVGASTTFSGLQTAPITVSSNSVVSANNFSISPNPANNWTSSPTVQVTMDVAGTQGGVSAVYVDCDGLYSVGIACAQTSTTPTLDADGTISVPLRFYQGSANCKIDGIVIVDGAGNVALYGEKYGAPDPGLTVTRIADTVPPTVTAASLNTTTLQIGQQSLLVNATVNAPVAPVNGFTTYVYDSTGALISGDVESGGVTQGPNGAVQLGVYLPYGTAPGTYTIGFAITDAAGLRSYYGPGGLGLPGGPLTVTVVAP